MCVVSRRILLVVYFTGIVCDLSIFCSGRQHMTSRRRQPSKLDRLPRHNLWNTKLQIHYDADDDENVMAYKRSKKATTKKSAEKSWSIKNEDDGITRGESPELKYFVSLDSKGDFNLYWDFDDVAETVFFRVEAKIGKSDLLAFGFSEFGEAENADFAVMWTGLDEKHRFQVNSICNVYLNHTSTE